MTKKRVRIAEGIYADQWGVSICLKVAGRQHERRFHPNTTLETLQKAREQLRAQVGDGGLLRRVARRGGDADEPLNRHPHLFGNRECYVYFVQDGDLIKIGRASDVEHRLSCLRGSNPRPLTLLASARSNDYVERNLHEKFKHLRNHGEWFRADADLLALIERVKAGADLATLAA